MQRHFLSFVFRFLDVLAARKDPSGLMGHVLIDGAPQPPNFKCLSGYVVQVGEPNRKEQGRASCCGEGSVSLAIVFFFVVLQDDVVMGTLTVRENLNFSAALRLPAAIPQEEKEQKVNKLIQELGLGRVADSRVIKRSNNQKAIQECRVMGRRKEEQEKQQAECYKKITSEMIRKNEVKQNVKRITEKERR